MKEKIIDLIYGLLLLIGIISGIYGICYEISILKWIGAGLVIILPTVVCLIQRVLD